MIGILLLLLVVTPGYSAAEWTYMPFDEAMKKTTFPRAFEVTEKIVGIPGETLYNFFKEIYEDNSNQHVLPTAEIKIPKIIHQIWLGSPVPESLQQLQQSWIEFHMDRGWSYKLWTDEDVAQLRLHNQEFYNDTNNYGVKSDILRWELLYNFGGVYIDMDYECLRSLDELHYTYDFYTALQPLDTFFVQLGAALCGSRAGHPILRHCIETIADDWYLKGAPKKTGPVHFTKSFYAMACQDGNIDIAFPAFYFYPLGCQDTRENRVSWTHDGAFAVHWWAKSWMPKNYRPAMFKDINNDSSTASWND